jgi:hypothetical protein
VPARISWVTTAGVAFGGRSDDRRPSGRVVESPWPLVVAGG